MLQLLLGRSGAGKTHEIYERLTAFARAREDCALVLLVPEQFSFASERALLQRLGPALATRVQVLSFTRLAQTVFRELGGLAGQRMDDATRVLLMSCALEQVADHLTMYRRQVTQPAYIESVLALLRECKQCAASPLVLEHTAAQLAPGTLRQKVEELSLIFGAYEALAGRTHIDPLDDLQLLADRLPQSRLLDGAEVFVDGFKGFTAQEMRVLCVMFQKARRTTVSLCTDTLQDVSQGSGLFSSVIDTAEQLRELCYAHAVPVAKVIYLTKNYRAQNRALQLLERGCFAPHAEAEEEAVSAVTLVPCGDIYAECDWVARTVRRRLREEGLRARDCAIVMRNLEEYRGLLDVALEKEGIPFYMDTREDIFTDPLITLLQSAMRVVAEGWDTEELLRLMKTGLLAGFSAAETAEVENYVYLWRIRGKRWKETWESNPRGLSVKQDDSTAALLQTLNERRERLVAPLLTLENTLQENPDGRTCAQALFTYLQEIGADIAVQEQAAALETAGETALAAREARLWEVVMSILDKFAATLAETRLAPARLTELFALVAQATDLGEIPVGVDAVQVGSIDRIRFSAPAAVWILGANEGVFPAYPAGGGMLSDKERRLLQQAGLSLTGAGEYQVAEERFFAYTAMSAPSQSLYISYLGGQVTGESLMPSVLVEMTRNILPHCREESPLQPDGYDIEGETDAFARLAPHWHAPTPVTAALYAHFTQDAAKADRVAAMERAAQNRPAAIENTALAKAFFGRDMRLSPSRVDSYHQCKFSYFCRYGLRAQVQKPAELDAMAFGTLAHYVMEKQLKIYVDKGFHTVTRAQTQADARLRVTEYVDTYMGGTDDKPRRFLFLLSQLIRTSGYLLWQVVQELAQSQFVPVAYELEIGDGESETPAVPPVVLTLPDGTGIRVVGKVDRVDVFHKEGVSYVRVVDYKTGGKEFELSEVMAGINLQMLIYLFSICQNGAPAEEKLQPAGVLYLPAHLPVVQVAREATESFAERERLHTMCMKGLLLDDPEILRAMESDAAGLFIPAKLDSNGLPTAHSSVASLARFGQLKVKIEKLLCTMAETLRAGDVSAVPVAGLVEPCTYCDFRAVCGHEAEDPVRPLFKQETSKCWKELDATQKGSVSDGE